MNDRNLRIAPFALALLCLILPFVDITCGGHKALSLNGIQLMTGTELEQKDPFSGQTTKKQKIDGEPLMIAVVIGAIVAGGLCFQRDTASKVTAAIVGGVAFVLMLVLKAKMDNEAVKQGKGLLGVEYQIGFILMCVFLLAGTIIAATQSKSSKKE